MTDKERLPPSQWIGTWLKSETFWREMTTRTISGLFVAGVVTLGAVAAGFGDHQQRMQILAISLVVGVALLVLVVLGLYLYYRARPTKVSVYWNCIWVTIGRGRKLSDRRYVYYLKYPGDLRDKLEEFVKDTVDAIIEQFQSGEITERVDRIMLPQELILRRLSRTTNDNH
jgi:uncharacterized membrane protein